MLSYFPSYVTHQNPALQQTFQNLSQIEEAKKRLKIKSTQPTVTVQIGNPTFNMLPPSPVRPTSSFVDRLQPQSLDQPLQYSSGPVQPAYQRGYIQQQQFADAQLSLRQNQYLPASGYVPQLSDSGFIQQNQQPVQIPTEQQQPVQLPKQQQNISIRLPPNPSEELRKFAKFYDSLLQFESYIDNQQLKYSAAQSGVKKAMKSVSFDEPKRETASQVLSASALQTSQI